MKSIPQTFLGIVLPAWWRWQILGLLPLLIWFSRLEDGLLLTQSLAARLGRASLLPAEASFLPFMFSYAWLVWLLFLGLLSHRGPAAEIVVGREHLELFDGRTRRHIRWRDIVVQEGEALDVWEEKIGQGRQQYRVIRMDVRDGERRVPLRLCHHLNPRGRMAPSFSNQSALRREFLGTLLRARPDLRIADGIYALCELRPTDLAHSRLAKLLLLAGMTLGLAAFFGSGYVYASFFLTSTSGALTIISGVVTAVLGMLLVLALFAWGIESRLLIDPQSPAARAARRTRFGSGPARPPRAADYPLYDSETGSSPPPRRCRDALLAGKALPADGGWDKLDGDDWYLVLDRRPELAEHCAWHKLDGEAWALLLPGHPAWARHCPWETLAPSEWATLISEAPDFDERFLQHANWRDFDGCDWAALLASRPALLAHCELSQLTPDDWDYLLLFQPDLEKYRTYRPVAS